jgi:hypothetical protein
MDLRAEIGKKVKWLLDNERKYYFWVPLAGLVVGGAVAYLGWLARTSHRRKLVEECCLVCYQRLREVVLLPCRHLILCSECASEVENCPVCRQRIVESVALGDFLGREARDL